MTKSESNNEAITQPRRFKSAFIIYSAHRHGDIKAQLEAQGLSGKTTDIAKYLSTEWANLSSEDRSRFEAESALDRARYDREKADYKAARKKQPGLKKRIIKDADAPKRPVSAYLKYSNERRAAMKKLHPHVTNGELSKLLSKKWKEAPDGEKEPYIREADLAKAQYLVDIAEYRRNKQAMMKAERRLSKVEGKRGRDGEKTSDQIGEGGYSKKPLDPVSTHPRAPDSSSIPPHRRSSDASASQTNNTEEGVGPPMMARQHDYDGMQAHPHHPVASRAYKGMPPCRPDHPNAPPPFAPVAAGYPPPSHPPHGLFYGGAPPPPPMAHHHQQYCQPHPYGAGGYPPPHPPRPNAGPMYPGMMPPPPVPAASMPMGPAPGSSAGVHQGRHPVNGGAAPERKKKQRLPIAEESDEEESVGGGEIDCDMFLAGYRQRQRIQEMLGAREADAVASSPTPLSAPKDLPPPPVASTSEGMSQLLQQEIFKKQRQQQELLLREQQEQQMLLRLRQQKEQQDLLLQQALLNRAAASVVGAATTNQHAALLLQQSQKQQQQQQQELLQLAACMAPVAAAPPVADAATPPSSLSPQPPPGTDDSVPL